MVFIVLKQKCSSYFQFQVLKSGVTQLQSDIKRLEKQKNSRKAEREELHVNSNGKINPGITSYVSGFF